MTDILRGQFASDTVSRHFDDAALLSAMARFEAALAQAQADAGVLPRQAADAIASVCLRLDGNAPLAGAFAPERLVPEARRAGTLAIPFVKALTDAVAVEDAQAARWVHWGATSQDVLDTALALQSASAGAELMAQLVRAGDLLVRVADTHRETLMTGRTLLQPATPVPFGWKAACWLSPLVRLRRSLAQALQDAATLQFGGASGIRAALGQPGDDIAEALAGRLALDNPGISWHGSRDRVARLGAELALAAGAMARIGRDLSLMMQAEVGEAFEPSGDGRGGSSAMPHKRNPVAAMHALQAGLRAPGLASTLLAQQAGEHERGLGTWQADWWTLGALFECAGSATEAIGEALEGLQVEPQTMLANLERSRGFVHAEAVTIGLAQSMGKPAAHALMERICREAVELGLDLSQALANARRSDPALAAALPESTLAAFFDARAHTGNANAMIDRTLEAWQSL